MKKIKCSLALVILFSVSAFCKEKKSVEEISEQISYQRLFMIERSINKNQVIYEAGLTTDGFSIENPIKVYWIMHTKKMATEPLNKIEKKMGYGIDITTATNDKIVFKVKSLPEKPITVTLVKGEEELKAQALMEVNGEECVVNKIYIESKSAIPLPKVVYIDITGVSVKTDKEVTERITSGKKKD